MKKKKRYGDTPKAQWIASARDRLHTFLLADETIRGVVLNGTRMINEMRANHEYGVLETLVLGRAYLGAGLMSASLKGGDRLIITVECSGPVKGLVVETNAFGEVRGFLKNVPIPIDKPMANFDLSPFFGAGFLSVKRILQDAKRPFTGQIMLKYGNIAQDLAHYYLESEQIPTAFNLSIKFDRNGDVTGAGGLLLQAMPGADPRVVDDLEHRVSQLPSLGVAFGQAKDAQAFIRKNFSEYSPEFLDGRRIEFMCHCNKEKVRSMLMMLPADELKDISDNGPFPLEIRCHHCNTPYLFSQRDLKSLSRMISESWRRPL